MLVLEKTIFHKYWLSFVRDSSRLHLAFVALCLLSVIRKQWLKQCNYSLDQSGLLTRFWTYFTSSVWNFCRWVADVPPPETSLAAKSEEKRMFSQAKWPRTFPQDSTHAHRWLARLPKLWFCLNLYSFRRMNYALLQFLECKYIW